MSDKYYSLIVYSFAMHLLPESKLPQLCYRLALIGEKLLIITPHKRPQIEDEWGWKLDDEISLERLRSRLYSSTLL